jgi:membrane protein required for colicin V production
VSYNLSGTAMNSFDLVVYCALLIAVFSGFSTGLLRSAVTILAYLLAMPLAISAVAWMAPATQPAPDSLFQQNWVQLCAALLVIGAALGKIGRIMLDEAIGPNAGFGDRLGGAVLGAIRVSIVATTLVLVFDRIVPPDRQPKFLEGSRLRPLLSLAGQKGFRSLPPELAGMIDQLKQERRI